MAQKKLKLKKGRRKILQQKIVASPQSPTKTFRWGESYTSLLLGIIVVIIGVLFFVSLAKNRHTQQVTSIATNIITTTTVPLYTSHSTAQPTKAVKSAQAIQTPINIKQQTYTVQAGDDLWHIAEKFYQSGYNYVDIIKANNLENPGLLFSGTKLVIPQITPGLTTITSTPTQMPKPSLTIQQTPSTTGSAITANFYTVQKGDTLWDIALRAYADGYKWPAIAKANNLSDPGVIFSGNVIRIPR